MGQWGVTGPLPGPLCLQPGLFMLLSTAFTAAHVLSRVATTRLSGCDMGHLSHPKPWTVCAWFQHFQYRSCGCSRGCLIVLGSMLSTHGNATVAAGLRGGDLQPVQGWGKLSVPVQGLGQPMACCKRSTWCVVTAGAVPTLRSWPVSLPISSHALH